MKRVRVMIGGGGEGGEWWGCVKVVIGEEGYGGDW